jgi:hypothetical protein
MDQRRTLREPETKRMKAILRRVVRLEDRFETQLSDKAKSSVRIIVTLAGSEPASLATSTCTRHVRADVLTEVVELDGARGSISDEELERFVASFPIEAAQNRAEQARVG